MPQKTTNSANKPAASSAKTTRGQKKQTRRPIRREVGAAVCLFLGLFSFIGYFQVDAWFITFFCGFVKGILGWGYYLFPPTLLMASGILAFHRGRPVVWRLISVLLLPVLFGAIAHLLVCKLEYELSWSLLAALFSDGRDMLSGGLIAGIFAVSLEAAFSVFGAIPLCIFAFVLLALSSVSLSPKKLAQLAKDRQPSPQYEPEAEPESLPLKKSAAPTLAEPKPRRARHAIDIPLDEQGKEKQQEEYEEEKVGFFNRRPRVRTPDQLLGFEEEDEERDDEPVQTPPAPVSATRQTVVTEIHEPPRKELTRADTPPVPKREPEEAEDINQRLDEAATASLPSYQFPPLSLLQVGDNAVVDGREEVALNRERLETTIKSFGIGASVADITRGPTVTRYDLELEAGVKLNKLTNLAGDLALSLGVVSVRIAPIPDKISTVGIEVPNKLVSTVYLHDIITAAGFSSAASRLTFAIGKDIAGSAVIGNIAKLPHLLIAGTTGSGKSVCMNSLILSLLFKATPDEVRLIMIDPKMVELGIYNGIPHLYIPVVTDPKKAAGSLQWAVVEMMKRYQMFSEIGVRDLSGYNAYQKRMGEATIPQVVIVIDELADLMLVASKEVEESICRVAQMGRASGMHLVIATQRPSADVITGLMKANIPSRIAFAVSSALESRIILDQQGAEKLVGMGDMLYAPLGSGKPIRVQGAFVTDEERERVINYIKDSAESQYSDEIMEQIEKAAAGKPDGNGGPSDAADADDSFAANYDELLPQAVDVIFDTKQASVSMLQRRLKLGYSRAARLMDQLEEIGVVGPFEGSKARQIIITRDRWREMQYATGMAPIERITDEPPFVLDMPDEDAEL